MVLKSVRLSLVASLLVGFTLIAACDGGGGGGDGLDHLVVSPDGATIDSGTTIAVRATGVTKSGRSIDVSGVTWVASAGTVDGTSQFSATAAGDAVLTASAEGASGTGTIHVRAPGALNVKVVDAATGANIGGAFVTVLQGSNGGVTIADGTVALTNVASGAVDVTVRATSYFPITVYGAKVRELEIPMRAAVLKAPTGEFKGLINFQDAYERNDPPSGSLWVGIAGPAIKGNILSYGFESLLGETRPIVVAGLNVDAPSNVFVYGVTEDYVATAPPGATAAFALGGEITLQEITEIIDTTGSSDLGSILAQAIPIFNRFYYAVETGLTVTASQTLSNVDLILDTKLSKPAKLNVPSRPVTDPNPVVIAAVDLGALTGIIPAGLGVVSGEAALETTVQVPPLAGTFADAKYLFLVVSQEGGTGSSGNNQQIAVLSRNVTDLGNVEFPQFFVPPAFTGFTANAATRTFAYPTTAEADFDFHTFTRTITTGTGGAAVVRQYEWDVLTPGNSTGFVLPLLSGTNAAQAGGNWSIQTLGLESQTYEAILTPGSLVDPTNYFNNASRIVLTGTDVP